MQVFLVLSTKSSPRVILSVLWEANDRGIRLCSDMLAQTGMVHSYIYIYIYAIHKDMCARRAGSIKVGLDLRALRSQPKAHLGWTTPRAKHCGL